MDKDILYKLKKDILTNFTIAALGLATSFNMLVYNIGASMDLNDKLKDNYTTKNIKEIYIPEVDKMQRIQNTAIGIGGASSLYLLLGLGIPLTKYLKNKKSLEKDII